jgi:hypothetical protein
MSFLSQNVFGANFGMNPNGNFYMGGWSHGANIYQFWTSRDFAAPNLAPYVSNGRLAYAGDVITGTYWNGIAEPYGGAVITGFQANSSTPGGISNFRLRYMQLLTTGWFTTGYA